MSDRRRCSRTACQANAVATLTYVYADSKAVLGPLALDHEPHHYDLCGEHAERLTAPRGWQVVRDPVAVPPALPPGTMRAASDDLEALADAVREAARAVTTVEPPRVRGHLRILRTPS